MQEKRRNKREQGFEGEDAAVRYLDDHGFKIVERNFRTKTGEIDIIAEKKGEVYFFEVKTRGPGSLADPVESLSKAQIRRIRRTAEFFLMKRGLENKPGSFGVIGIYDEFEPPIIECLLDAFE
jgi:putative endonuclease